MFDKEIILFSGILILFNLLTIYKLNYISKKINIFDYPDKKRKIHKKPISLIGGLLILLNIILIFFYINFFSKDYSISNFYFFSTKVFIIFSISVLLVFLMGVYDDKYDLDPNKRILILVVVVLALISSDKTLIINSLSFSFSEYILKINSISIIFTLLCFLTLVIALNMFDGINLQSGLFNLLFYLYFIIQTKNNLFIFIIIPIIFFIFLNYKNKVFLGDSGSYFLSILLAYFSIKLYKYDNSIHSDYIFLIFFLPVLDCLKVLLLRTINGLKVFKPDKSHLHHILLKKYGYNKSIVFLIILYLIVYLGLIIEINSFFILTTITFFYFYLISTKNS